MRLSERSRITRVIAYIENECENNLDFYKNYRSFIIHVKSLSLSLRIF